jgi:exodeoxyribonuclease-5
MTANFESPRTPLMTANPTFTMTGQQADAARKVRAWYDRVSRFGCGAEPFFYFAGYAGTGKTTITHQMIRELGLSVGRDVVFASYTGKAALVMTRHGTPATTIHKLCRRYIPPDEARIAELEREIAKADRGSWRMRELERQLAEALDGRWVRNEESPAYDASLIVIDECSMVPGDLASELLWFECPILVLGDPGQLPPIQGTGYFTAGQPDVMLTEIHRQAADSPIIQLATMAREGRPIPFGSYGPDVAKIRANPTDIQWLLPADQVITSANVTRRSINSLMRRAHGLTGHLPTPDDKVIITRNQNRLGLVNGVFAALAVTACDLDDCWFTASIHTEDGQSLDPQKIYSGWFFDHVAYDRHRGERDREALQSLVEADFGNAITVHKAQGSEWESVTVVDDRIKFVDRRRWLYTAITRARSRLLILDRNPEE